MRTRQTPAGREFHCDGCGLWSPHGWLVERQILCLECYQRYRPPTLRQEAEQTRAISRLLREESRRTRQRG